MTQENTIRDFYNSVSTHDPEKILSFFAENGEFHDMSSDQVFRGKMELRQMIVDRLRAIPDMRLQPSNIIGSGDNYTVEHSMLGTQSGPLKGPMGEIPASGKNINVPSCDVIRLKDGKIQTMNCYLEASILMGQIGAMPLGRPVQSERPESRIH